MKLSIARNLQHRNFPPHQLFARSHDYNPYGARKVNNWFANRLGMHHESIHKNAHNERQKDAVQNKQSQSSLQKTLEPKQNHEVELLNKKFANLELQNEHGKILAGGDHKLEFRNAEKFAKEFGGDATDWVKKSSSSYVGKDTQFEMHWVENIKTGQRVNMKTKFPDKKISNNMLNINVQILMIIEDILNQKVDIIEGFRDLESLYYQYFNKIKVDHEYFDFIRGFCEETEPFPRGEPRKLYAQDYLAKLDKEETEYIARSKDILENFLINLKQFLEQGGSLLK